MSREDADGTSLTLNEKEVLYKLLPVAFIFMCLVFGASTVRLSRSPPPPTFALALSPFSLSLGLLRSRAPCYLAACGSPLAACRVRRVPGLLLAVRAVRICCDACPWRGIAPIRRVPTQHAPRCRASSCLSSAMLLLTARHTGRGGQVHFDDSVPIPGHLFPIAPGHPVMWPMGHAEAMVEARIQIQSSSEPGGGGGGGHHRRRTGPSDYKHSFLHNNHKWNRLLRLSAPKLSAPPSTQAVVEQAAAVQRTVARPQGAPPAKRAMRNLLEQPPAPTLPEGWQAVWDEEYQMYYYWNTATDDVTWDQPAMPAPASPPAPPGGHATGGHEEDGHATGGHGEDGHATGGHVGKEHVDPIIDVYLFEFNDMEWENCDVIDLACIRSSASDEELLGRYKIKDEEQAILMEFHLKDDSKDQFFIVISEHPEPLAIAISLHSLGGTGSSQVFISAFIMVVLFGMIMTEVLHRTMAAMIGAAMCMIMLAVQNRVPSLSKVVGWMDHGTLGLLWGMMLIVGITMRTGVFEWTGVLACKLSKGDKTQLLLLLCVVTAVLSAFLDNVTTILLIAPVTCKLCKLVKIDPRPFLISEAIFSNIGGTATMIGDPPNIIIGNMLSKFVDFNAFLFNLGPGVIMTSPPVFYYLVHYFKDSVSAPSKFSSSSSTRPSGHACSSTPPRMLGWLARLHCARATCREIGIC